MIEQKFVGFMGVAAGLLIGLGTVKGADPLTTERVASGLTSPVYVTHAPGDTTRLFIVEQVGRVRILDLTVDPPVLQPIASSFLNITGRVIAGGERGLLGLAFHPDFANNRYLYVNYTTNVAGVTGDTRISRFEVPMATPNDADETTELFLMTIDQPQSNHNGGWIAFGPDNYLYIGMGDGGNANDQGPGHTEPGGNAQDLSNNLLGKMLRIDVNGDDFPADPAKNYANPPTNPFVGVAGDDEIWSYGLRNPWRNAFDSLTGDLYIADVGQNQWEEVSFQPASSTGGENYGWRCREGMHNFLIDAVCVGGYTEPIHEYSHGVGCSITGGEVYRGCAVPSLHGTYFFADYCSAQIWSFQYTGVPPVVTNRTAELDPPGFTIADIVGFGRDAEGEIYICDHGGEVFKIVPVNPAAPCSTCGDNIREGTEQCDGTDDVKCPGACLVDCTCPYEPDPPAPADDTCYDGPNNTGVPCTASGTCPAGQTCANKSRYLSVTPPDSSAAGGIPRSIKMTVADMPLFPSRVGQVWWAGAPQPIDNSPLADLTGAMTECTGTPHSQVWDGVGTVHLFGTAVVPGSTYEIRMCDAVAGPCSDPVVVTTAKWGDVVAEYGGPSQPNFADIGAIVSKFQNVAAAPSIARTDLVPEVPNGVANFMDISAAVAGFTGFPYPFTAGSCP